MGGRERTKHNHRYSIDETQYWQVIAQDAEFSFADSESSSLSGIKSFFLSIISQPQQIKIQHTAQQLADFLIYQHNLWMANWIDKSTNIDSEFAWWPNSKTKKHNNFGSVCDLISAYYTCLLLISIRYRRSYMAGKIQIFLKFFCIKISAKKCACKYSFC